MDVNGVFAGLESHALRLGVFERVNTHEPKNRPHLAGLTCALWLQRFSPARSGLESTSLRLAFTHRIYTNMLAEPQDAIDPRVLKAIDVLGASWLADLTLGGLVRTIDVRGMDGTGLEGTAGYLHQDGSLLRVVDITLPVIVNDVWAEAP